MLKIVEKSWMEFWAIHRRIDDRHRILGIVERGADVSSTSRIHAGERISLTDCNWSKGFVGRLWEAILERSVEVALLLSTMSGADECKFGIRI